MAFRSPNPINPAIIQRPQPSCQKHGSRQSMQSRQNTADPDHQTRPVTSSAAARQWDETCNATVSLSACLGVGMIMSLLYCWCQSPSSLQAEATVLQSS